MEKEEKTVISDETNKASVGGEEIASGTNETIEAPDANDIEDILALLNVLREQTGGKDEITEVPENLQGSIRKMYQDLKFIRELFSDPLWIAIMDDLADQKEDGGTPSVEVAIARNVPLDKLQELADSEDYQSAQEAVQSNLDSAAQEQEDDVQLDANFEESKKAGEDYAAEMGYSQEESDELFQMYIDLLKVMADGKLTKEEFAKLDKMRNYDKDIQALGAQIEEGDSKEVLPDQASVEATIQKPRQSTPRENSGPGLSSMSAYDNVGTDITQVKGQKRRGM